MITMEYNILLADINMRDPFIYVDKEKGRYHLFGTTSAGSLKRFEMYLSTDLVHWNGPIVVFDGHDHPSFWGRKDYWAPEVYYIENLKVYLMFATVMGETRKRGTVAFITEDLVNVPFRLYSDEITPEDFTNLDGTLFYDTKTGTPKIIFCHEWLEINDGSFVKGTLSPDLKKLDHSTLKVMFYASEIPWSVSPSFTKTKNDYISDGPFIYKRNGIEYMLYSTFGKEGYQTGYCYSENGWETITHAIHPLTEPNSGHAMIFTCLDGIDHIIYHTDNDSSKVRPRIKKISIVNKALVTI